MYVALCAVRHLVALARTMLGNEVVLYTTDPPPYVANGTLAGDALFSCAPASAFVNRRSIRITERHRAETCCLYGLQAGEGSPALS